jgi:hypothetical protein
MCVKFWLVTAKISYLAFLLAAIPQNRKRKWAVFLLVRNLRSSKSSKTSVFDERREAPPREAPP